MTLISKKNIRLPGLRNIKTAIATLICILIYNYIDSSRTTLAVLSSLICMQDSVEKSIKEAKGRVFGNIFGAIVGIVITSTGIINTNYALWAILCIVCIILIIYTLNILGRQGSIVLATVVFTIVAIDSTPLSTTLLRVVDTYVGISVALLVNIFLFNPKKENIKYKILERRLETDCFFYKKADYRKKTIVEGKTLELFKYPKESIFANRDFDFRISTRNVSSKEFKQQDMDGYYRYMMITKGRAKITHENHYSIELEPFREDFYNGSWKTETKGTYEDFILSLRDKEKGGIKVLQSNVYYKITCKNYKGDFLTGSYFYCLEDNVTINILKDEKVLYEKTLNKKSALFIKDLKEYREDNLKIIFNCKDTDKDTDKDKDNIIIRADMNI